MPCPIEVIFPIVLDCGDRFNLTFSLRTGSRIVFKRGLYYLSGDNGSGKTSFLNLLSLSAGRIAPSTDNHRGTVIFNGTPYNNKGFDFIRAADIRENAFAIFPQKAFFLPVSSRDNYRVLNGSDEEKAKTFSDREFPDLLSGGQQQKLLMDIVLNRSKPIWFLDEPLANLDAERRLYFWKRVHTAFVDGVETIFFIDHWMGNDVARDPDFSLVNTLRVFSQNRKEGGGVEFKAIKIYENSDPDTFFRQQMHRTKKEKTFRKKSSPLVLSGSWGTTTDRESRQSEKGPDTEKRKIAPS